jgi:hypothetical protein
MLVLTSFSRVKLNSYSTTSDVLEVLDLCPTGMHSSCMSRSDTMESLISRENEVIRVRLVFGDKSRDRLP